MGKLFCSIGGGGGGSSDDCTALKENVLVGTTAVTHDSDDEPIEGTMANNGAVAPSLNCGETYAVPKGYHDGNGVVTANSLASQTAGNAAAGDILSGKKAWVNGALLTGSLALTGNATAAFVYTGKTFYSTDAKTKLTGAMTISSVVSFSIAAYSTSQVTVTWKNPAKGPYSGVLIRYKTGAYPTSVTDGTQGYKGVGSNKALSATSTATIGGLAAGTTYYFRIWVYCTTSAGTLYSDYKSATGKPTASGRKAFTASGTWTVPANVRTISVHCTGGGGGGSGYAYDANDSTINYGGGGGAGGYTVYKNNIAVTPGQVYTITIGTGGKSSNSGSPSYYGCDGSASSFANSSGTVLVSANGGGGSPKLQTASMKTNCSGGSGGSAGGKGSGTVYWKENGKYVYGNSGATAGRSNGASGDRTTYSYTATGQGTTTREFGSSSGTLYAGGGGGASTSNVRNAGGAGGGGASGIRDVPDGGTQADRYPIDGSSGTGGGGGGGTRGKNSDNYRGGADGGCGNVIIKW